MQHHNGGRQQHMRLQGKKQVIAMMVPAIDAFRRCLHVADLDSTLVGPSPWQYRHLMYIGSGPPTVRSPKS